MVPCTAINPGAFCRWNTRFVQRSYPARKTRTSKRGRRCRAAALLLLLELVFQLGDEFVDARAVSSSGVSRTGSLYLAILVLILIGVGLF